MIASSCVDFNHSLMDLGSHFTQPVIWVSGRAGRKVAGVLLALLGGGFTGVQSMGSPGTKMRRIAKSGTMDNQTTAVS